MGFSGYQFAEKARQREKRKKIRPVWRGIGCLFMVTLALIGYFVAGWFLRANAANTWIYIPRELIVPPYVSGVIPPGVLLQLAIALLVMLISYGVVSFFYALTFPKRPGETDVPTPRRRRGAWRSRGR